MFYLCIFLFFNFLCVMISTSILEWKVWLTVSIWPLSSLCIILGIHCRMFRPVFDSWWVFNEKETRGNFFLFFFSFLLLQEIIFSIFFILFGSNCRNFKTMNMYIPVLFLFFSFFFYILIGTLTLRSRLTKF